MAKTKLPLPRAVSEIERVLGINHRDLAKRLGVGESVIRRWVTGEVTPHITKVRLLQEIADEADVEITAESLVQKRRPRSDKGKAHE